MNMMDYVLIQITISYNIPVLNSFSRKFANCVHDHILAYSTCYTVHIVFLWLLNLFIAIIGFNYRHQTGCHYDKCFQIRRWSLNWCPATIDTLNPTEMSTRHIHWYFPPDFWLFHEDGVFFEDTRSLNNVWIMYQCNIWHQEEGEM